MKNRRDTRGRWREGSLLTVLPLMIPMASLAPPGGRPFTEVARSAPDPSIGASELAPIEARLTAKTEQRREEVLTLLGDYGPLLRFLPLDRLVSAAVEGDTIELRFDFEQRSTERVELCSVECWVVDPKKAEDPLAEARAEKVTTKERTLIVHRRVRLECGPDGIHGVASGDLEIAYGIFAPNVELTTELRPGGAAHDLEGRIVLSVDEAGSPLRENGRWIPVRADRWLILTVHGTRLELPLED